MTISQEHLAEANRHIADAERRIERQRHIVERCAARGQDTRKARALLDSMTHVLDTMEQHRGTILAELAEKQARRAPD